LNSAVVFSEIADNDFRGHAAHIVLQESLKRSF
jgi:hypothetical protein